MRPAGASASVGFDRDGVYPYFCAFHGAPGGIGGGAAADGTAVDAPGASACGAGGRLPGGITAIDIATGRVRCARWSDPQAVCQPARHNIPEPLTFSEPFERGVYRLGMR